MATEALFISTSLIKEGTNVDENVDEKIIREAIIAAQDMHIKQIIGSGLFDQLQTQIIAGSVTAANQTLLDEIKKPLKWWAVYEGAYMFQFKLMNKGIVKRESDSSTTIERVDLVAVMDSVLNRAQNYSKALQLWLLENENTYPLYNDPGDGIDVIYPKRDDYDTGINLSRRFNPPSGIESFSSRKNNCGF